MAANDAVVKILQVIPPGANFSYMSRLAGGSTPAENVTVWTFPDAASTRLDFIAVLEGYDGGGLTFPLKWSASVATGNVEWEMAVRRFQDDGEDLDSAHTYVFNTVTAGVPSAINEVGYDNITFTDGADMDSWADRELAIIRLLRNAEAGNTDDTAAGIAYLWGMHGYETA
jgi:hypothetical protein